MGIWEENASRAQPPWNGSALTRGMEFGVSPFPESRREMIERGRLFGTPTFRWIPAATRVTVEYWATLRPVDAVPETLEPPGRVIICKAHGKRDRTRHIFYLETFMRLTSLLSIALLFAAAPRWRSRRGAR